MLRGRGSGRDLPRGLPRRGGEFDRFHTGAAYLALVTGAPIVPVVQFGTREPGAGSQCAAPKGGHVDMVFGDAVHLRPGRRGRGRKQQVEEASLELREHLIAHLDHAKALTGRTLPGPVPRGKDKESDDPDTGIDGHE